MTVDNGKLFRFPPSSKTNIHHYNGIAKPRDPNLILTAETFKFPNIPQPYADLGVNALIDYVIQPFADGLKKDLDTKGKEGWKRLMAYDKDSARSYMIHGPRPQDQVDLNPKGWLPYPTAVINWLETVDTSTSAFDRALSEVVIDKLFNIPDNPKTPIEWFGVK